MDESKLDFWSGANYMKRLDSASDSEAVTIGAFSSQTIPVAHGLGHVPGEWFVGIDVSGVLWANNRPYVGMDNASTNSPNLTWDVWSDTTTMTITVYNNTASSKSGTVYWAVYMDYDV